MPERARASAEGPRAPSGDAGLVSCPHGATCGACALLDVPYAAQLVRKRATLVGALARYPRLGNVDPLPCVASPVTSGYRNRAKMVVERSREGTQLGYFRFGTRRVVDAPECRVLVPEVLETTRQLRSLLSRGALERLALRFVDVRCGSDPRRQHLTLVVSDEDARFPLAAVHRACPFVAGISANVNPGHGAQVIKGPLKHLWGDRGVVVDAGGGLALRVSAGAFFQVNLSLLRPIHERLRAFFDGCHVLADLYAGVGTHGLALAPTFSRVTCIEGVSAAARDARTNAEAAGFEHVAIVGSPVERALSMVYAAGADAVVLNPSREGARPEVIKGIAASRARRVAYLSCEPATLARDVDALVEAGFDVASVTPIDMMPQTLQVEALALLLRTPPPPDPTRAGRDRKHSKGRPKGVGAGSAGRSGARSKEGRHRSLHGGR